MFEIMLFGIGSFIFDLDCVGLFILVWVGV